VRGPGDHPVLPSPLAARVRAGRGGAAMTVCSSPAGDAARGRLPGRLRAAGWRVVARELADPRGRYVGMLVALVLTYAGAAQLSYRLEFAGPVASIVWLPVGVGVAFLYLGGLALFPGVLVGDLLANDYSKLPALSAFGQSVGNLLEVVVAVLLIRRLVRRGSPLDTVAGAACLLVAIAVGTAVSATVGTASLWLGDVLRGAAVPSTWRTWWLGDTAGALIVVPLAIAWWKPSRPAVTRRRAVEAGVLFLAVAALSDLSSRTAQPVVYVVFPLLMWAALRFGRRGATLAVTITVGFTIWNTTHSFGPFASRTLSRSVVDTQLFIGVAAVSTLLLAALVSERERFTGELAASRSRLVEAGQRERRRLEQDLHDGAQQRLTWLAADLGRAGDAAREHPSRAPGLFARAEKQLRAALDELRDLAHGIHPAVLTELGLAGAIRSMTLRSSVPIVLGELPAGRLDDTAETAAYYVVAEAIANAQKHARSSHVDVSAVAEAGVLRVVVADDGVGGARAGGSGLQGLRDRVEGVGGEFLVQSPPGRGTRITATIPLAGG
jgi:two-component system, NarL family, sensor histidine kinase FusK